MPAASNLTSAFHRQILLQLGSRLKRARLSQGLTTIQMAERAGVSRMTLSAVESGEPTPTMGSYLRIMGVLGVAQDLVLVASDDPHGEGVRAVSKSVDVPRMAVGNEKHELQDLQSLMLHQEAIKLLRKNPELIDQARATLERWRAAGNSRSSFLWDEWSVILHRRAWRQALSQTKRAKELRQASPLTVVLPAETRQRIIDEVQQLKKGVRIERSCVLQASAADGVVANGA